MSEDKFKKDMKEMFEDLEILQTVIISTNSDKDITIYSYITKKEYSSEQEYKKDLRKFKLNQLNAL